MAPKEAMNPKHRVRLGGLAGCLLVAGCSNSSGSNATTFSCSSFDPAAKDPCAQCVASACSMEVQAELGAGWASDDFSGPCTAFIECVAGCACNDATCFVNCRRANETSACAALEQPVGECTDKNCPACTPTSSQSSGDASAE
jgi:hypothetical protein